jgi:hypothetical protein
MECKPAGLVSRAYRCTNHLIFLPSADLEIIRQQLIPRLLDAAEAT